MTTLEVQLDFGIASCKYDRKEQQNEAFVVLWRAFGTVIGNSPRFVDRETFTRAFSKALNDCPDLVVDK